MKMVKNMNVKDEIKARAKAIEAIIYSYMPSGNEEQKLIYEAMNYSIKAGGKRLRPMLMQETYQMFGGHEAIIEPFMAAIEMIHTYSLVHDDLPAMDNDDYRRGCPTTHIKYGHANGILAGDGLLNLAFETVFKARSLCKEENLSVYNRIFDALEVMSAKAGVFGMIGGQVIDITYENKTPEPAIINRMYELKTSALIEASMMVGAILSGATQEDINKIEQIAKKVGIAFQIQDDILDVTSSVEVLGKPIKSDEKNHKVTYVSLLGLEKAKSEVERMSDEAILEFGTLSGENDFLLELIKYLIVREN